MPAVNSWLSWIPDEVEATAIIEDDGDTDGIPRGARANATWTWVRDRIPRSGAHRPCARPRTRPRRSLRLGRGGAGARLCGPPRPAPEPPLDRRRHFSQAYWSDRRSAHVPAGESTE
ncbi:hypothetical protein IOD13_14205 [Brevibacterium casei]|nr:hypothetical protein [Brevibacterium casei]